MWSAPLRELAARVPPGRVADVGCGHGVVAALLDREVVGIDPDPRKISWAQRLRLPRARFETLTVEALAAREPRSFDAVVVADVLYLLPLDSWPAFLNSCRALLKPGGRLVVLDAEGDGSWRHKKALLQERLMVRFLNRTRASGGLHFEPREVLQSQVEAAGFRVTELLPLSRGYTTPHVILSAECA